MSKRGGPGRGQGRKPAVGPIKHVFIDDTTAERLAELVRWHQQVNPKIGPRQVIALVVSDAWHDMNEARQLAPHAADEAAGGE